MLTLHDVPVVAFTERLKRALFPVSSYSGRGMFGVGVWSEARYVTMRLIESQEFNQYELVSLVRDMRQDGPVCYWPMREWVTSSFDDIAEHCQCRILLRDPDVV